MKFYLYHGMNAYGELTEAFINAKAIDLDGDSPWDFFPPRISDLNLVGTFEVEGVNDDMLSDCYIAK